VHVGYRVRPAAGRGAGLYIGGGSGGPLARCWDKVSWSWDRSSASACPCWRAASC
jgi:hypothetical protein